MVQGGRRIDADIAAAADFAQPILMRVRELVRETCPRIGETMKWSLPTLVLKTRAKAQATLGRPCNGKHAGC